MVKSKSHKRQKSSLLNIGYYFSDTPPIHQLPIQLSIHQLPSSTPNRLNQQTAHLNTPISNINFTSPATTSNLLPDHPASTPSLPNLHQQHPELSPVHSHSNASPNLDQNIYENDVYTQLSYNFPPQDTRSNVFYPVSYGGFDSSNPFQTSTSHIPPPANLGMSSAHSSLSSGISTGHNYTHLVNQPLISSSQPYPQLASVIPPAVPRTPRTPKTPSRSSPSRRHARTHSRSRSVTSQSQQVNLPPLALPRHKQNLSISSHFKLFSLEEPEGKRLEFNSNALLNEFISKLVDVDQQTINNFLLFILGKLDYPIPLDDFYNLLYNDTNLITLDFASKLDKTMVQNHRLQRCIEVLFQVLELFKKPDLVATYVGAAPSKDIKLSNINYHELLRTFLAIKILQDMLIELPKESTTNVSGFNIPRLSLYKTYYIICQKLLLKYPSSLTSDNDHYKLILGQSKLGKLIKLVYPNLLIKRLGSRGESKYNYLGVVWNENIINDEIVQLCDNYELTDLNELFDSEHKTKLSTTEIKLEPPEDSQSGQSTELDSNYNQIAEFNPEDEFRIEFNRSIYSYLSNDLKFPDNFNLIAWLDDVTNKLYSEFDFPLKSIIEEGLELEGVDFDGYLVTSLKENSFNLNEDSNDLKLYFLLSAEILPIMLFLKPFSNLKGLKTKLLYFIELNSGLYNQGSNLTNFKKNLKNIIYLNDLLIVLLKKVFKSNSILSNVNELFNNSGMLINNLIDSLISCNLIDSFNYDYLNEHVNNIKKFFVEDLVVFLKELQVDNESLDTDLDSEFKLTNFEVANLLDLLKFMNDNLINNFNHFPVLMFINFLNLVSNDVLKSIYFKSSVTGSFDHWWSITSFIQDYLVSIGELYGLFNEIYP